jgi:hypothetical protein
MPPGRSARVPQFRPRAVRLMERMQGAFGGGHMTALIVGLVSIAVVWLIVIYGSIYVNKNVQ